MSVSGNLKTMLPGDLLQWLSLGQKTGTLCVRNKGTEKKIFFRNGRVISSASNDPREYLGQFLMSHGYITEPELMKAMEVQAQSRILLGKILVMIDVITEEDLQRLMRLKAEEEIYDIFLWNEGDFQFADDDLPQMEMIPLQVDVTGLIMEGTRRVDEWNRIHTLIGHEGLIPNIVKEIPEEELEDDAQRTVINAIDGKRSLAELVLESRSSSFNVASTVFHLTREGYVKLTDPTIVVLPTTQKSDPDSAPFEEFSEDDEIVSLIARAQQSMRGREYEKAQRLLKAAEKENKDSFIWIFRAYEKGAGTKADPAEAWRWLVKAADTTERAKTNAGTRERRVIDQRSWQGAGRSIIRHTAAGSGFRKSSSRRFSSAGFSSIIQWPAPSIFS